MVKLITSQNSHHSVRKFVNQHTNYELYKLTIWRVRVARCQKMTA